MTYARPAYEQRELEIWERYHSTFSEFARLAPCFSPQMVYNPAIELSQLPTIGAGDNLKREVKLQCCSVYRLHDELGRGSAILVLPWQVPGRREIRLAPVFYARGSYVARFGYQQDSRMSSAWPVLGTGEYRDGENIILNECQGHVRSFQVEFMRLDASDVEAQIAARGFDRRVANKGAVWHYSDTRKECISYYSTQKIFGMGGGNWRTEAETWDVVPFEGVAGMRYVGIIREGSCHVEQIRSLGARVGGIYGNREYMPLQGDTAVLDEYFGDSFAYSDELKGTFELYTGYGYGCQRGMQVLVNGNVVDGEIGSGWCGACEDAEYMWKQRMLGLTRGEAGRYVELVGSGDAYDGQWMK